MRLLRSLFLLATCSTSLAFSAITRMHTARVSSWRRQHAATKAQLDHNGSQEFGVQKKRKPARMTRGRAHKVVREKDKFAMEDVLEDPEDLVLARVEAALRKAPRTSIAQQLDTGTVHKLREEFTTGADEDACYLLDGEDKKMYFMCSSPPDNPNMYCEEMADGMDWVCVVEDDAFTRDLLDDFSA